MTRARKLWEAGAPGDPGLLNPAWLPWIEASLRSPQRRFLEAQRRINEALDLDSGELRPQILLTKSSILEALGDLEGSTEAIREAVPLIRGDREPRLAFGLRFNLLVNLSRLGQAVEAERGLPEVQALAEHLGGELDLIRTFPAYPPVLPLPEAVVTEPSLPARTQIAFGLLLVFVLTWSGFLLWTLTRRKVLLVRHRVLAGRLAVLFCSLFTFGALALGLTQPDQRATGFSAAGMGGFLLLVAVVLLIAAQRRYRELTARRRYLERELEGGGSSAALLLVALLSLPLGQQAAGQPLTPTLEVQVPVLGKTANCQVAVTVSLVNPVLSVPSSCPGAP